jgi:tRNA-specific 2-thiouridylase
LYVLQIDPRRNALVVGPASQLGRGRMRVKAVTFVSGQAPRYPASVTVKIRYTGCEAPATIRSAGAEQVEVTLGEPLRDVTPGQAAVFYQGPRVLGGGIIAQEEHDGRDEAG